MQRAARQEAKRLVSDVEVVERQKLQNAKVDGEARRRTWENQQSQKTL